MALVVASIALLAGCVSIPATSTHKIDVSVSGVQAAAPPATGTWQWNAPSGSRGLIGSIVTNFSTLDVAGDFSVGGKEFITAGTAISVTNGAAFAISASWQPVKATGTVTPTITIPSAGVRVCVENITSSSVVIADTGNQVLGATRTLGQYDVLCGFSDGTRFIETSFANN
jgi:hypothetical protein